MAPKLPPTTRYPRPATSASSSTLPTPCSMLRKRSAFTLIELLVVITIIAILAGLSLAVMGGVQKTARITETKAMANQIKAAISAYYAEYGVFPTNRQTDAAFVSAMTGATNVATLPNRRGIRFLEIPQKFWSTETFTAGSTAMQTPARFYPKGKRETFSILTDAMSAGSTGADVPYDGKIVLPGAKTPSPGTVAVYVSHPDAGKTGTAGFVGSW